MKEYVIHCNEEQLQLLRSAVELQMRVRIGQGWAITENLLGYSINEMRETLSKLLDDILRPMVFNDDGTYKRGKDWIERDMWIGLENALGMRTDEIGLSEYGLLKVEEVSECG